MGWTMCRLWAQTRRRLRRIAFAGRNNPIRAERTNHPVFYRNGVVFLSC